MSQWLQRQWYRISVWHLLLWPLSLFFRLLVCLRRWMYRSGMLASVRLPVPVLVVGNITVGGTGKTPLVLWLAEFLRSQGYRPGVISRGYKSQGEVRGNTPQSVSAASDPALVGDEPVLLAKRLRCPVWVGTDRVAVARALLKARPDCNVLISDDGLQHYRLERDMELVVVDGVRLFGNGCCLPAGPLREPVNRLRHVDALVLNGTATAKLKAGEYAMRLVGTALHHVKEPGLIVALAGFVGKKVHAFAGIGNPARFFADLRRHGLDVAEHPFPDHHAYQPTDLQCSGTIIMTEKDAVKCSAFAPQDSWYLAVDAQVDDSLGTKVMEMLKKSDSKKVR